MTTTDVGAKPQAAAGGAARTGRARARRRFRYAPAIGAGVGMVALWHVIVTAFEIPTYIAPSPWLVLQVFAEQGDILWINFLPTLLEAVCGFALGNSIAVLLAVWFVHSGAGGARVLSHRGLHQHDPHHRDRADPGADAGQRL